MFSMKNNIAEAIARIPGDTKLWQVAMQGPRYKVLRICDGMMAANTSVLLLPKRV